MDSELHFLTYDPDQILEAMASAYIDAGGRTLYPGDEKEILLRGVQQMFVQAFAGIDNALRMSTLRYAIGEYLDLIGENRDCPRIEAVPAEAVVSIETQPMLVAVTIPAGTALTADGVLLWKTSEAFTAGTAGGTYSVPIECSEPGTKGNALTVGTLMQFVEPQSIDCVITCSSAGTGGTDREQDDVYRDRIRRHGLTVNTAGSADQYERLAMAVSTSILDANAINGGDGVVDVYLLLEDGASAEDIIDAVEEALSDDDVRPLTDTVTVREAVDRDYTINAVVTAGSSTSREAIMAAGAAYQAWQDGTIGNNFNPDRLKALLYQAGASLVTFGAGSNFDGGTCEYTVVSPVDHCKGTVSIEVTSE